MGCSFGDHLPIKRKQGLPEYITCILFGHLNPQIIKNTKNQNYHSHHCYIFEKLGDLNGSSRMSNMTFPCVNSIQLVPTMEKKDLYVIIFGEISENEVHKSYCHKPIFMWQ